MPTKSLGLETLDVGRDKARLFFFGRAWRHPPFVGGYEWV